MQRTYRSKKDSGGLCPKDLLLTSDDRSSAFDALFIENIKKAKRELSSLTSSSQFNASNKVRKRKFVKRVVKDLPPTIREVSANQSTFLTPDKSIHVKRTPDLFDQLLKSPQDDTNFGSKYTSKYSTQSSSAYGTKKYTKKVIRKINCSSSDDTQSEKENSRNVTDIRQHQFIIETDKRSPANYEDESINQLVNNIPLFNCSIDKETPVKVTKYKRNRLTTNIQSPKGDSPLCSTPFAQKYRGASIYKLSPIVMKDLDDSVTKKFVNIPEETLEVPADEHKAISPVVSPNLSNLPRNRSKSLSYNRKSSIQGNKRNKSDEVASSKSSVNYIEDSFEATPFIGFDIPADDNPTNTRLNNLQSPVFQTTVKKSFVFKNSKLFTKKKKTNSLENKVILEDSISRSTVDEAFLGFSHVTERPSIIEAIKGKIDINEGIDSENIHNNVSKDELPDLDEVNEANFSEYNSLSSATNSDAFNSDKESMYDTCDSEDSEVKMPVVVVEKLNDSVFERFYNEIADDNNSSIKNEDLNELVDKDKNVTPKVVIEKLNDSVFERFYNEMPDQNDSSVTDEVLHEQSVDKDVNDQSADAIDISVDLIEEEYDTTQVETDRKEEKQVSFVTTRRGNDLTNNSMMIVLDDSTASSDFDKTVISVDDNAIKTDLDKIHNVDETIAKSRDDEEAAVGRRQTIKDTEEIRPPIVLQPGKKWERSLSIYRRMTMVDDLEQSLMEDNRSRNKGRKYRESVIHTMGMQDKGPLHNESICSRRNTIAQKPSRSTIKIIKEPNSSRVSLHSTSVYSDLSGFLTEDCDDTVVELSKLSIADSEHDITVVEKIDDNPERVTSARDYVLRRCNQTEAILFDECYPDTVLKNCHKIGEGVYGEVFLWRARDGPRVMKVVPVAGALKVNGEHQKDFQEIISEIVIAMELSALRAPIAEIECDFDEGHETKPEDLLSINNATDVFNQVLAVRSVVGHYPARLLDLWELYDECKGSENDNPAVLPADQQYIVLELANAGQDLEGFQFNSAEQAYALFLQVAYGLAVGEEAFQFEHRDLHWGNVLIAPTEKKYATFVLRGRTYRVLRRGVAATIIDYSLSRLSLPVEAGERVSLFNDLAADEGLFDAVGDYQFDVYRLMRDKLSNDWKNFEPYTNILWLHYTVDKMITALRYKRTNTKIHKHYIAKLKSIKNRILQYGSAVQFVLTDNEF